MERSDAIGTGSAFRGREPTVDGTGAPGVRASISAHLTSCVRAPASCRGGGGTQGQGRRQRGGQAGKWQGRQAQVQARSQLNSVGATDRTGCAGLGAKHEGPRKVQRGPDVRAELARASPAAASRGGRPGRARQVGAHMEGGGGKGRRARWEREGGEGKQRGDWCEGRAEIGRRRGWAYQRWSREGVREGLQVRCEA